MKKIDLGSLFPDLESFSNEKTSFTPIVGRSGGRTFTIQSGNEGATEQVKMKDLIDHFKLLAKQARRDAGNERDKINLTEEQIAKVSGRLTALNRQGNEQLKASSSVQKIGTVLRRAINLLRFSHTQALHAIADNPEAISAELQKLLKQLKEICKYSRGELAETLTTFKSASDPSIKDAKRKEIVLLLTNDGDYRSLLVALFTEWSRRNKYSIIQSMHQIKVKDPTLYELMYTHLVQTRLPLNESNPELTAFMATIFSFNPP